MASENPIDPAHAASLKMTLQRKPDKSSLPGLGGNGAPPTVQSVADHGLATSHDLRALARYIEEFAAWHDKQMLNFIENVRERLGTK